MFQSPQDSRRQFIAKSSALAVSSLAIPTIISSTAMAKGDRPGANDRIAIAGIGVGRQGSGIVKTAARDPRVEIVCICDVYRTRAEQLAKQLGAKDVSGDYREVLERSDVDAIMTATPEHWRANICISAALAGKHVYAEKPLTLTIPEGRLMVKAARQTGVTFQVGSQQRCLRENFIACEFIRRGGLGEIREVVAANYESPWLCNLPAEPIPDGLNWEMWCGPNPVVPFNQGLFAPRGNPGWLSFRPYSGGEMTGWGTHGIDQIQCALGLEETGPIEIVVEGPALQLPTYDRPESNSRGNKLCSSPRLSYRYANGITVRLDNGSRGGGIFLGSEGKMEISRGRVTSNPASLAQELLAKDPRRTGNHIANWLDCCYSGEKPTADVEVGHRSATICHLLNIGRLLGRNLQWDPQEEHFVDDQEANQMLTRPIREGYQWPKV